MLRELRKKFTFIVMAATFCVFFLLLFTINAFNISAQLQRIDRVMSILTANNGDFPTRDFSPDSGHPPPRDLPELLRQDPEAPFTVRYCSVFLDNNLQITKISTDRIAALSQEDAASYAQQILEGRKTTGYINSYRFQLAQQETGYVLVFLDVSEEVGNILFLLVISCVIGITAYLVVFLLVVLVSKKAVLPIAESYEKQKQFIADVSHELKTPLTVISADSEILAMTFGENEWCDGIDKQTAKMRHLLSRMITLTRLYGDSPHWEQAEFSLSEAVYDTAMAFLPLAQRAGKELSLHISPELLYTGNEGEIRQCVSILLDNAVKYCDDGGSICVSLYREKRLHFIVTNTYSQASTLEYRKLFDRFYRADDSRSEGGSYGLGLSIARSIVHRHRGEIRAYPDRQDRICFQVVL